MTSRKTNNYQIDDYKQWIALPPQIPIPYNDQYLHTLNLQFFNIQYLNTNLPINQNKPSKI